MKRKGKPPKIDLMLLLAPQEGQREWNRFLSRCLMKNDLHALSTVFYGIQLGMDDLVKKKMNTDKVCVWFVRMQHSLEKTMKQVMKRLDPHPLDNPLNKEKYLEHMGSKRQRDTEIEDFLRKHRY